MGEIVAQVVVRRSSMPEISHQTIRLSPGRHAKPSDGMCVMELASTLAGEAFSDRPVSVSPVVAELLRRYNDAVDDERRQALIPYAALAVGTRASGSVERERAHRCLQWVADRRGKPLGVWRPAFARLGAVSACGARAACSVRRDDDAGLAALRMLVDELIGPVPAPQDVAALRPADQSTRL
jgi:hypothetical protein